MMFRLLIGLDSLAAAIVVYFFLTGLADGSVSDFNAGLWAAILLGLAALLAGALALHRSGWPKLANLVLAILAVPTALYGFFLLTVILTGTSWN